jgi:hypothetical protein
LIYGAVRRGELVGGMALDGAGLMSQVEDERRRGRRRSISVPRDGGRGVACPAWPLGGHSSLVAASVQSDIAYPVDSEDLVDDSLL